MNVNIINAINQVSSTEITSQKNSIKASNNPKNQLFQQKIVNLLNSSKVNVNNNTSSVINSINKNNTIVTNNIGINIAAPVKEQKMIEHTEILVKELLNELLKTAFIENESIDDSYINLSDLISKNIIDQLPLDGLKSAIAKEIIGY